MRKTPIRQNTVTPAHSAPKVGAERVQSFIRSRFNPIRTLTPQLLAQYLDEFKAGYLRSCALTFEAIEDRDDTLKGVAAKRKKAAARNGWEILLVDSVKENQKAEAQLHKEALLDFYNNITVTNAIDTNQRGQVSLLVRQMMDAVGKLYAVHEIIWKPNMPAGVWVKPGQFSLSAEFRFVPLWFFENQTGALRFLPSEFATIGEPLEENGWLVTVGDGLMAACAVAYMYKTMSLRDWVIYNERHGMPGIHGKTDAAKDSPEWDALVTAVQNFAADWSLVTNTGATIEKVDMATTGQLPYPPLVERMDRAMAALWRGADLSTISGGKSDAGQGASLQGDETNLLEADDTQLISETLNMRVDKFVIEYHFGQGTKPLAYFKLKTTQKKNIAVEIQTDTFLLDSGVPLGVKNTLERYNRPVPDPKDALLTSGALTSALSPNQPAPVQPSKFVSPERSGLFSPGQPTGGDAGLVRPSEKTRVSNSALGPAGSFTNRRPLTVNRQQSDSPAVGRLLAEARMHLAEAQESVLQPLRNRLAAIAEMSDASAQRSALEQLRKDFPQLLKQINSNPETAKVLEKILSESLLQGLTTVNGEP